MRIPVPTNKLVAFTLVGALLTAIVAVGLAGPLTGLTQSGEQAGQAGSTNADPPQQVAADAPTPNQNFTPAVQTQSEHEEDEHEEYEDDHDEGEDDGEGEDHEEEE